MEGLPSILTLEVSKELTMKSKFTIAVLWLPIMATSAGAQMMASHAPSLPAASPTATAAPSSSLQVTGKAVARVNGVVLTDRDLLREMFALFPYAKLHNGFPKAQEAAIRQGAMQMIIFEELVYQEAVRRKMTIAPERVALNEKKFRQQFDSQQEFDDYLKTDMDGSEARLRQQIKRSLLIEALLKSDVQEKSTVSTSEARLYYDRNPRIFEHGEDFSFQSISILPPANASPETLQEARTRAEKILQEAKATKNYEQFGLLAEKVSEDDFRVDMGDHRVVMREKLPSEVVKVMLAMKPGEVSNLVQLGNAYTMIRLNGHGLPRKDKFADVKADLMTRLQKQKYENLRVALDQQLRQKAKIEQL